MHATRRSLGQQAVSLCSRPRAENFFPPHPRRFTVNFEALGAFTPYATFFLAVIIGIIGWLLKWMINGNHRQFAELHQQIRHLGVEIKELEKSRQLDQKYIYE
jgi:H+/Cl- antiporter ClcA